MVAWLRIAGSVALLFGLVCGQAGAAPKMVVRVVGQPGVDGCPAPRAVAAALAAALPSARVVWSSRAVAGETIVEVIDEGARYRVHAGGIERVLNDADRRCADRARAAAVFAALALLPPGVPRGDASPSASRPEPPSASPSASPSEPPSASPSEPATPAPLPATASPATPPAPVPRPPESPPQVAGGPPESPPPGSPRSLPPAPAAGGTTTTTPPPPAPTPLRAPGSAAPATATPHEPPGPAPTKPPAVRPARSFLRSLRVELEPSLLASLSDRLLVDGGVGLRLAVGRGRLALTAGASIASTPFVAASTGSYLLARVPFDLGLRLRALERGRFDLQVAAAFVLLGQIAAGQGFATSQTNIAFDPAVRGGLMFRVRASSRVAPFIALDALISPQWRNLTFLISGAGDGSPGVTVGSTPVVRFELALGISVVLH